MRYGADDPTPPLTTLLAALQYISVCSAFLVYPVLLARLAEVPLHTAAAIVAFSLAVMGLATMVHAVRGPGGGFLYPMAFTGAYVAPAMAALEIGGLPLVFGMTACAGVLQVALASLFRHVRFLFPPEVAGLVIMLIGLTIGDIAVRNMLANITAEPVGWLVLGASFGTIACLAVWGRGAAARYAVLIGVAAGYALALLTGVVTPAERAAIAVAPLFGLPAIDHLGWRFETGLLVPFGIAALGVAITAASVAGPFQAAAGRGHQGDPAGAMARCIRGNGIGTLLAGGLGTLGPVSAPVLVPLVQTTGLASRRIAWAFGGICLLLALMPPLAMAIARLPQPVLAGVLLFAGSLVLVNGMQVAVAAKLDTRRGMVVGLGIFAALAAQGLAGLRGTLPPALVPILTSPFVLGSAVALVANLVLRIRSAKVVRFELPDPRLPGALEAAWPTALAPPAKALPAVAALLAELPAEALAVPVAVRLRFDEFGLRASFSYPGAPPALLWRGAEALAAFAERHGLRHLRGGIGPGGTRINLAMAW